MKSRITSAVLILGMVLISTLFAMQTAQADHTWLATGTVTKIDGNTFYLLGKNNVVYTINAGQSEVIVDNFHIDCYTVRVGDTVRVFGCIFGTKTVEAKRVRILKRCAPEQKTEEPGKEIKIIMQANPPEEPASEGNGPVKSCQESCSKAWDGQGLINDIDYSGHRLKVQTSSGPFSINTCAARLSNGNKRIGFGLLNIGDAVRISGKLVGQNEVDATQICVMRTKSDAENALPSMPISVAGVIQQIDYASMTFRMRTANTTIVVAADANTMIQQQTSYSAFKDLRAGMRIKMSGCGSLGAGYTAQHIQIIGISP